MWKALFAGVTVVLVVLASLLLAVTLARAPATTVVSLAPNEKLRVHLVELRWRLDRNFELRLENVATGATTVIFSSPDEGVPIGSERVLWSRDSSRVLLVGRHFSLARDERIASGEALYLLYDARTGEAWCNASQQRRLPSFTYADVAAVDWATPDI
jgi:hypothetical protein